MSFPPQKLLLHVMMFISLELFISAANLDCQEAETEDACGCAGLPSTTRGNTSIQDRYAPPETIQEMMDTRAVNIHDSQAHNMERPTVAFNKRRRLVKELSLQILE